MLDRFARHVERRDLEATVALFGDDGAYFGSEVGEWAVGTAELRDLFDQLFARSETYTWSRWDLPIVGSVGQVIWFVMPATLVERGEEAEREFPYRLSGVLDQVTGGAWLFRLLNGSEPVPSQGDGSTAPT
jgi:ketosteroid isomerase-like protein